MVESMTEPERPTNPTPEAEVPRTRPAEVPIARPAKGTRYNPTEPSSFQPQNVISDQPNPRPGLACVVMIVTMFIMIGGFLAIGFALYKGFEVLQQPKPKASINAPIDRTGTRS